MGTCSGKFVRPFTADCSAFEESNPSLSWLVRRHRLAIISNADDHLLPKQSSNLVWRSKCDHLGANQLVQARSCHFDRAVKVIGEHPSSIIHIAEGRCEATPARALGMRSIWVNRSPRSDDGSNAQPNAVVSNLTQLVEAIS